MQITKRSTLTGVEHTVDIPITTEQLDALKAGGGYIQRMLPHLDAGQREFLITGITPEEWAEHVGDSG